MTADVGKAEVLGAFSASVFTDKVSLVSVLSQRVGEDHQAVAGVAQRGCFNVHSGRVSRPDWTKP